MGMIIFGHVTRKGLKLSHTCFLWNDVGAGRAMASSFPWSFGNEIMMQQWRTGPQQIGGAAGDAIQIPPSVL